MMFRSGKEGQANYRWLTPLLTGGALFYVLFFFKGYNIQTGQSFSGHSLFVRSLVFGLATALVFYLYEYHVVRFLSIYSTKSKILGYAVTTLAGALVTWLLFNYFWNWTEWSWYALRLILVEYTLVMIIPLSIIGLVRRGKRAKLPDIEEKLTFASENGRDKLLLTPGNFLGARSAGNYVEILYLSEGTLKKHLIRNRLKRMEVNYRDSAFVQRCHRSFLVNPTRIQNIRNGDGKMELDLGAVSFPVSVSYQDDFIAT